MSDPTSPIGVTGATGRLGGRVARRLAAAGVAQRVPVRDLSRAPQLPGSVPARAPFDDPAAVRTALAGVPTVLMVSASETPDRVGRRRRLTGSPSTFPSSTPQPVQASST